MVGALFVAAILVAPPARAAAPAELAITRTLQETLGAVRGTDDNAVSADGLKLQEALGGLGARFRPSLHEVRRPHAYGSRADLADMIRDAKDRLAYAKQLEDPAVREAVQGAEELYKAKRARFDGTLPDDDMGIYVFTKEQIAAGTIKLNPWLKTMGYIMPIDFLMATYVHEVCHQRDPNLATEGTLDGEVVAFACQYKWLKQTDRTGERLALLRVELAQQMHDAPNPITAQAINYAATLDVLVGTGGDKDKLKQFAYELGYRDGPGGEGPEHHPAGS